MTEQELYDTLLAYLRTKTGTEKYDSACFVLVAVGENEDNLIMGSTIIDPGLPEKIERLPTNRTLPQHIMVHFNENVREPLDRAVEVASAFRKAANLIGRETLIKLLELSNSKEEFTANVNEEIRKR